jgi:hypothetical protein
VCEGFIGQVGSTSLPWNPRIPSSRYSCASFDMLGILSLQGFIYLDFG